MYFDIKSNYQINIIKSQLIIQLFTLICLVDKIKVLTKYSYTHQLNDL